MEGYRGKLKMDASGAKDEMEDGWCCNLHCYNTRK